MIDWNVVTTGRPLFRWEYPFLVLRRRFETLHDPALKGTYWYHVCLVPFWITVAEEDEYREEDVDSKLEYLQVWPRHRSTVGAEHTRPEAGQLYWIYKYSFRYTSESSHYYCTSIFHFITPVLGWVCTSRLGVWP